MYAIRGQGFFHNIKYLIIIMWPACHDQDNKLQINTSYVVVLTPELIRSPFAIRKFNLSGNAIRISCPFQNFTRHSNIFQIAFKLLSPELLAKVHLFDGEGKQMGFLYLLVFYSCVLGKKWIEQSFIGENHSRLATLSFPLSLVLDVISSTTVELCNKRGHNSETHTETCIFFVKPRKNFELQ